MLKNADFKLLYTSGDDDEPSCFLFDALSNSNQFDLALGYFRSTGFSTLALGFSSFIMNGGSMRFIINDSLVEKDKNAILYGYSEKTDQDYEKALLSDLNNLTKTLSKRNQHFFDCLTWLISSDRLQIIAVVPNKNKVGIVHHKFGVFTDKNGDKAAFSGSLNFSQYALNYNIENIWCEYSWQNGATGGRINTMINLFEKTWNGTSSAIRIIPIENVKTAIYNRVGRKKTLLELLETECELAKEIMIHPTSSEGFKEKITKIIESYSVKLTKRKIKIQENKLNKWKHQEDAVQVFLKKERGVLNMATGTGKTRTALTIANELIKRREIESLIVTCDGNDLLDQWHLQLLHLADENDWIIYRHYGSHHQCEKFRIKSTKRIILISRQQLDIALTNFNGHKTLLIHDEVHKLGSKGNQNRLKGLSDSIRFRLGLSATPEREYDEEGTQFIYTHIGELIFEFSLEDAINKKILTSFNYFPIPYTLTDEDNKRLKSVHVKRASMAKNGRPMSDEEFWMELSRVYKTAEGKIIPFTDFISKYPKMLKNCIVFVETKEYGEKILEIIHRHHTNFHTYYGGDDSEILTRFANGEFECLLTCHRLSEGIDIKSLENVILISSAKAKLETIQRIGRCIRYDPKNADKIANVIDLIRSGDNERENSDHERELFLSQLANNQQLKTN